MLVKSQSIFEYEKTIAAPRGIITSDSWEACHDQSNFLFDAFESSGEDSGLLNIEAAVSIPDARANVLSRISTNAFRDHLEINVMENVERKGEYLFAQICS